MRRPINETGHCGVALSPAGGRSTRWLASARTTRPSGHSRPTHRRPSPGSAGRHTALTNGGAAWGERARVARLSGGLATAPGRSFVQEEAYRGQHYDNDHGHNGGADILLQGAPPTVRSWQSLLSRSVRFTGGRRAPERADAVMFRGIFTRVPSGLDAARLLY
jgi:hypothetical protein